MLDMRYLRRNPEEAGRRLARRGGDFADYEQVLPRLVERWRGATAEMEGLEAVRNKISKQIGRWKAHPPKIDERVEAARAAWALLYETTSAVRIATRYLLPLLPMIDRYPMVRYSFSFGPSRSSPEWREDVYDLINFELWSIRYSLPKEIAKDFGEHERVLLHGAVPHEYMQHRDSPITEDSVVIVVPAAPEEPQEADQGGGGEPDWEQLQSLGDEVPPKFWDELFGDSLVHAVRLCQYVRDVTGFVQKRTLSLPPQGTEVSGPEFLPNFPTSETPDGAGEADNVVLHTYDADGKEAAEDFAPTKAGAAPHHVDVGEALGGFHAERGVAMSGSRFVVLSGELARLHRALGAWMLDLHLREHGYTEWTVPHIVTWQAGEGSGQLPKFAEDTFHVMDKADSEGMPMVLISTSEMALVNVWRDSILDEGQLPQRLTALTPCYRREAGAAGKDTRGLIRLHQFEKVEMVQFCHPEQSEAILQEILGHAERVLRGLRLPYRVLDLCAGDLGFAANRTFDLEVWLPGAAKDGGAWREISSCSNCGDFQARRAAVRFRPEGGGKPQYLHTLNGSGVAVGRCLAAVLENYHREGRGVEVPAVLRPYMGGQELLPFAEEAGGAKGG